MAIDTKKAERRTLAFKSFDDVRAELDQLARAHAAGTLRTTGNWTPGQNFAHLAAFMTYPLDGYPSQLAAPPWIVRMFIRLSKKKFLYGKFPVGVFIPGVPGGTTGADDVTFEEGAARLRGAMDRLEKTAPSMPNPLFGPLTHEEWKAMNTRHCELHLGFLQR